MIKLLRFRVTNFRSVDDSGWIETDNVAALIGTNESGKTNLLVPLWKLNPAKDGQINPISDYPRKRYNEIRSMEKKPIFIEADFDLTDDVAAEVAREAGTTIEDVRLVNVKKDYDSKYHISFPNASPIRGIAKSEVVDLFSGTYEAIKQIAVNAKEEVFKKEVLATLDSIRAYLDAIQADMLDEKDLNEIQLKLTNCGTEVEENASGALAIVAHYTQAKKTHDAMLTHITKLHPNQIKEARQTLLRNLPSFVYYSNYGNLDSEIYLPHVMQNMQRTDLGQREEAKLTQIVKTPKSQLLRCMLLS